MTRGRFNGEADVNDETWKLVEFWEANAQRRKNIPDEVRSMGQGTDKQGKEEWV